MTWLTKDISLSNKVGSKKLSLRQQKKLIQLFHNLLSSGFTLTEMVDFLERSRLLTSVYTDQMRQSLLEGKSMAQLLADLGFSDGLVTQLALADVHGNTQKSLAGLEDYLEQVLIVRKKLIEVATYPLMLLAFLVLIMLGLKNYLLPQLEGENLATTLINHFPLIFLGIMAGLAFSGLLLSYFAKKIDKISLYSKLCKIPYLGQFISLYLTAYYAREWGNLIGQGLDLAQVVQIMQDQKSQLFQEIGLDMQRALLAGQAFHDKVLSYPFFKRELSLMIAYGEVKSRLGQELELYAKETWKTFFHKLNQASQLIQPLVFLFVALMIVMIYAAMLLPIYQNMPSF
ncbi:competence type IV pilus assembly protein ComGB [Streptococcus entericus]|uniref:competence type IV pilus assembly protein ComGB n=1 Tax=Streptococcus entericus TaxID=155680 RepID=UPI000A031207|nr:competence type IV pilus assembly protein ComGB [Streptococcus entericus]